MQKTSLGARARSGLAALFLTIAYAGLTALPAQAAVACLAPVGTTAEVTAGAGDTVTVEPITENLRTNGGSGANCILGPTQTVFDFTTGTYKVTGTAAGVTVIIDLSAFGWTITLPTFELNLTGTGNKLVIRLSNAVAPDAWVLGLHGTYIDGDLDVNGANTANSLEIVGGTGVDLVEGSAAWTGFSVSGGAGNDVLTGGTGNDTINGGAGDDLMTGNGGTDTLSFAGGSAATVNLATISPTTQATGNGTDTLGDVFENAVGSSNNDTFKVSTATTPIVNAFDGGAGTGDTIDLSAITVAVTASLVAGTVTAASGVGADTVTGIENVISGSAGDTLTGDAAANTLNGGAGDDTILPGTGAVNDVVTCGDGTDTISFAGAAAATVDLSLTSGQNTGNGTDTITGCENVTGSSFNDTLKGTSGNNVFNGGDGSDTVSYASSTAAVTVNLASDTASGAGTDTLTSIENATGGSGNDSLTGDAAANVLTGGNGNDTFVGGDGNDTLDGGAGTDTASYKAATTALTVNLAVGASNGGGQGSDDLVSIENVQGGSGNDTLTGSGANNVLAGGKGNDRIGGGAGADTLNGGAGNDQLSGGKGNDTINGGPGTDTCKGGPGNNTIKKCP